MKDFNAQVNQKKKIDQNLMHSALGNILRIFDSKNHMRFDVSQNGEVEREVGFILKSMDVQKIEVPDNIEDDENVLTYIMSMTGISRRKITLHGDWWKNGSLPLLCVDGEGNFTALIANTFGRYQYVDKNTGLLEKVTKELAESFTDVAYCFYKPFENKKMSPFGLLKSLLGSFGLGDIVFLVVLSLVIGMLGLVLPALNQIIFNEIIPSGTMNDIGGIAIALIGVAVVTAIFSFTRSAWILRIGNKMEVFAQNAVWSRIFSLPVEFFSKYEAGDLVERANAVSSICYILNRSLIPILLSVIFSFIYLFQIMTLGEELFIPTIVIVMCLTLSIVVTGCLKYKRFDYVNKVEGRLSSLVFQIFSGISKIKLVGAEVRAFSKWADLYSKKDCLPHIYIQLSSAVNAAIEFGGVIALYVIAKNTGMSSSSYIAFNVALGALLASVMELSYVTDEIALIKPLFDMIKPIIEAEPENTEVKAYVDRLSGKIEVNQVSFRYGEELPLVLDNLTLNIEPGEYVAITGSSGCGKSTLMRILMGFEKPEMGGVYYDDRDFSGLDMHSVRQRIGIVLQNGKLFAGDIYSNIVICAPWLTIDDAWVAAEKAGFADDIRAMPMGMFTMISDGGGGISGGQQQRLLIARALAANPDILMFDEATSALDNLTQKQVVNTLESMDITRIVIAHRLSTIKNCSRIIYMHKGKVAEMGTYDELMELDGMFADMAKRQLA